MAELARKGLMPAAGGTLDQAAGFLAAARFVWREEEAVSGQLKAES